MTEIILVMNGHVTKSYRKLMYGQINDTKYTKTFISRPFGNSLDLRFGKELFIRFTASAFRKLPYLVISLLVLRAGCGI